MAIFRNIKQPIMIFTVPGWRPLPLLLAKLSCRSFRLNGIVRPIQKNDHATTHAPEIIAENRESRTRKTNPIARMAGEDAGSRTRKTNPVARMTEEGGGSRTRKTNPAARKQSRNNHLISKNLWRESDGQHRREAGLFLRYQGSRTPRRPVGPRSGRAARSRSIRLHPGRLLTVLGLALREPRPARRSRLDQSR
jgi:hypothetical protein